MITNKLETNEIETYHQMGYLLVQKLFNDLEISQALAAIQEMLARDAPSSIAELEPEDSNAIRRIWSPTKRHKIFDDIACSDKLLDRVESLIGPNILFHYSKLNMKAPRVGSIVEWHQDFSYYPHTNSDLLSCLIYLDDADISNGCLEVIPGSHRRGILNHYIDGFFRGKLHSISEEPEID
jgi:phytanoyl-CoA hydroxylase